MPPVIEQGTEVQGRTGIHLPPGERVELPVEPLRPTSHFVDVVVWVCPAIGCGNYYAAKHLGDVDLTEVKNFPAVDNKAAHIKATGREYTFMRSRCPDCNNRGIESHRRPVRTKLAVETAVPDISA